MKKQIAIILLLAMVFNLANNVSINAIADAVEPRARVLDVVGDGVRYYVIFEYKGTEYRSDEMGPAFNTHMWNFLNEEDKERLARNYGFGTNWRLDQYGKAGSQGIVDYWNDKTGWTELGEAWRDAVTNRDYPQLASFFGDVNDSLKVVLAMDGDREVTLGWVKNDLNILLPDTKEDPVYGEVSRLINEIMEEFEEGQRILAQLKSTRTVQIANAIKGGSKLIIKDIVTDNVLVPNMIPGGGSGVAAVINFLKNGAEKIYSDLSEEPTAGEIVTALQALLDGLEDLGLAYKYDIEEKLTMLAPKYEYLYDADEENRDAWYEELEAEKEENEDMISKRFTWTVDVTECGIPWKYPNDYMVGNVIDYDEYYGDCERYEEDALIAADDIAADYADLLEDIKVGKHNIYMMEYLNYDDDYKLDSHPGLEFTGFGVSPILYDSAYPGININANCYINPAEHIFKGDYLNAAGSLINSRGSSFLSSQDEKIGALENYMDDVKEFLSDEDIKERLDDIAARVNGLRGVYSFYSEYNLDISMHRLKVPTSEDYNGSGTSLFKNLAPMLENVVVMAKENADTRAACEYNMDQYSSDASAYISQVADIFNRSGYDDRLEEFGDALDAMQEAYSAFSDLYAASPYLITYSDGTASVNEDYINGLIDEAEEGRKDAVATAAKDALQDIRAQETLLMEIFEKKWEDAQFAASKLDLILKDFAVKGNFDKLEQLLGKSIKDSEMYLEEHGGFNGVLARLYKGDLAPTINISGEVLDKREGRSTPYYNVMMVADDIELDRDRLINIDDDEEFAAAIAVYRDAVTLAADSGYYSLDDRQKANVNAEKQRGYGMLTGLEMERIIGSTPVYVESITPLTENGEDPTNIVLEPNKTYRFYANIYPENADNKALHWYSDNSRVATVDDEGKLSTHYNGNAHIYIYSDDGRAEAMFYLLVIGDDGSSGEDTIRIDGPTEITVPARGESPVDISYRAMVTTPMGMEVEERDVDWSLVESIAGVSLSGNILRVTSDAAGDRNVILKVVGRYSNNETGTLTIHLISPEPGHNGGGENNGDNGNNGNGGEEEQSTGNQENTGGGGSSGSSGSSNKVVAPVETPKTEMKSEGNTVTASTTVAAIADRSGKAAATINQEQANGAINTAMEHAKKQGKGTAGKVEIKIEAPADASGIEISIPKEAINQASEAGISTLVISTPAASMAFDADVLSTFTKEATEELIITASKVEASSLLPEAQNMIGDRPVFDFSVKSGNKTISQFEGDVLVSMHYIPKENEDTDAIIIYYINDSGVLEIVSNGIYNSTTRMISFKTRNFSRYAVGYNKVNFKDVAENAWYGKAIRFIAAREITTGTGNGNFSPEAMLTRGQFIVMLMKSYGMAYDADPKDNFADGGDTYYTGYLAAAKRLGISRGIGNNMFAPDNQITRQEMFTLLYNALRATGRLPEGTVDKPLSSFTDADNVASWANEAIAFLVEAGIIVGSGDMLSATDTTTRGEMAQVLYNLLSK